MPTYEYLCDNCGYNFETKQSFKDEPLTLCPNCNHDALHRVPQAAGVVFKGSGWYITDSKGKQNLATSGEKKADAAGAGPAPSDGEVSSPKETPASTTPPAKTETPAAT